MSQPSTPETINYKDTLNLPITSFPMKAGASTREPEIQAFWATQTIYESLMAKRQANGAKRFLLHDGPPYLSSDKIHIGTALNKILKDIVTRYKTTRGYYSPYVPGYDGHGLPIENAVVKSIKGGRHAITQAELRQRCRDFAHANLNGQEQNFKRLAVWGNWGKPYITIDPAYEALQIELFADMYQKGYVYKGLKPVYWCPTCETALADAEVEYADHSSHSIYVAFPITQINSTRFDTDSIAALQDARVLIWTTTPWTLPANLALAVHPQFEYSVVQTPSHGKLVVASGLLETLQQTFNWDSVAVLAKLPGEALTGITTTHPFMQRPSVLLTGTHVTLDAGTGIVHTAPGHGVEDYEAVQAYNHNKSKEERLPILSPLDGRGCFLSDVFPSESLQSQLAGLSYEKANPVVVEILSATNALLQHSTFSHSYPHCWRCHKPVIYRATEQWFIGVEQFRAQALEAIKTVDWLPPRGEARITSMVEGRSDWCISRQRVWGVPIPVFYCNNPACQKELLSPESIQRVSALFREHSSDCWWSLSASELLGTGFTCTACGGTAFEKEMDIMDVWFDSGVSHTAVVEARKDELGSLPVELYLEGSDQHRGWFQSALLTSVMLTNKAPYQAVLTHGFVLDEQGRKMSKSLGNIVEPQSIIDQYGADVLRLWVASVDYTNDIRIGPNMLKQLAEVYKKIRNTVRYMMGNLHGFDPEQDRVPLEQLSTLDRYILHRLTQVIDEITGAFDRFEFHQFYQVLQNFCIVDLSAFYFDVMKDTLYTHPKGSLSRRRVQTVLYELLSNLSRLLIPVMPHLAEDIWSHWPEAQKPQFGTQGERSILETPWPEADSRWKNTAIESQIQSLLAIRDTVNKALEEARSSGKLGSALQAQVYLQPKTEAIQALLTETQESLSTLFLCSQVYLGSAPQADYWGNADDESITITVLAADGEKCSRCWKFEPSVGSIPAHPTICDRCHEAVSA